MTRDAEVGGGTGRTRASSFASPADQSVAALVVDLTDAELADMGQGLHRLLGADPVDFAAVRRFLADWALTVRLRRHPDFAENAAAFDEALDSEGITP